MSFGEAVRAVLHRWSDFGGRSSRTEYWFWWLAAILLQLAAFFLIAFVGRQATGILMAMLGIVYLVLLVPSLAVFVRRLHDSGRSGWWWLIALVPYVGALVLLVFMCLDSTPGPNAFGPPPRGSRYEHPSDWRVYAAGMPGSQQPGWGAPPPPPGPPSAWGSPASAPQPRPGMPPAPGSAPAPAWQQTQAQTAWQQPPVAPAATPAPNAWQQPPTQPSAPVTPPAPSAWQQPPTQPAAPAAATPDPWRPSTVPCRTCGQVLAADAAFCSRCGRPTAG